MALLPSSIRSAGRSILGAGRLTSMRSALINHCRAFSAAAALTREQVEERVLGVLQAFDRVNKDKVPPDD